MPLRRDESLTKSDQVEVLSRSSSSPLADVYNTEPFRSEWANEVRFHVARNILHLRRYRKLTQSRVGKAMKTSQSAIARIENAQENITVDTLKRIIVALKGRLYISIPPQEFSLLRDSAPWWELAEFASTDNPWKLAGFMARSGTHSDQVIIGLERKRALTDQFLLVENTTPLR